MVRIHLSYLGIPDGVDVNFETQFSGSHLENITHFGQYLRVPLGTCQTVILPPGTVYHDTVEALT